MATALYQASTQLPRERFMQRWFFAGMAILMLASSIAGFAPAILSPAGRRGPLSLLVVVHGLVFLAWLLLFLTQSQLAAAGRVSFRK